MCRQSGESVKSGCHEYFRRLSMITTFIYDTHFNQLNNLIIHPMKKNNQPVNNTNKMLSLLMLLELVEHHLVFIQMLLMLQLDFIKLIMLQLTRCTLVHSQFIQHHLQSHSFINHLLK